MTAVERPDWPDYFFGIARAVAARADCTRARHGAVIVRDRRIVATGYNAAPSGGPSCLAGDCPRGRLSLDELPALHADYSNCVAVHAEQNAIVHAREDLAGAFIYITGKPCDGCAKLCAAAGLIVRYPDPARCGCGHQWDEHDGMGDCRHPDDRTTTGWCERCPR